MDSAREEEGKSEWEAGAQFSCFRRRSALPFSRGLPACLPVSLQAVQALRHWFGMMAGASPPHDELSAAGMQPFKAPSDEDKAGVEVRHQQRSRLKEMGQIMGAQRKEHGCVAYPDRCLPVCRPSQLRWRLWCGSKRCRGWKLKW